MPLIREDPNQTISGQVLRAEQSLDGPTPAFWGETLPAAFRLDNTVLNAYKMLTNQERRDGETPVDEWDLNYDPFEDIRGTRYERYSDSFVDARNSADAATLKAQIDQEFEDRATLEQSGGWGVLAGLTSGLADPLILLPGAGLAKSAKGGYSLLRSAGVVGGSAALMAGSAELILQSAQETRTKEESIINIAAAAFLGGLFGAGAGALSNRAFTNLAKKVENDFQVPGLGVVDDLPAFEREVLDLGAAATQRTTISQETLKGTAGVAALTRGLNPVLRMAQSPSHETRIASQALIENPLYFNKNAQGIASPQAVETLMKEYQAGLGKATEGHQQIYKNVRKAIKAGDSLPMDRRAFNDAVARSMRRGDTSDNPLVQQSAEMWRTEVFDPLKDQAIKAGLLPEDVSVETADSYFSRLWNRNKIVAREPEFREIVSEWAGEVAVQNLARVEAVHNRVVNGLKDAQDVIKMAEQRAESSLKTKEGFPEFLPRDITEANVRDVIAEVKTATPPEPEGLTAFLHRSGGLTDEGGELEGMGLNAFTRPGFAIRNGADFDVAAKNAFDEGFFPHLSEPPTRQQFFDELTDDFSGTRRVVRLDDEEALSAVVERQELLRLLEDIDVNPKNIKAAARRARASAAKKAQKRLDDVAARISRAEADHNVRLDTEFNLGDEMADYIDDIVQSITEKLKGNNFAGSLPHDFVVSERGPLANRTFSIQDELVEEFLENDVERVAARYTRTMGADIEMKTKFGDVTLDRVKTRVSESYDTLREAAATEADRTKLQKSRKSDLHDIDVMRDLLRGTYQNLDPDSGWAQTLQLSRLVQYMSKMGGVTLSSLPDTARMVMVHGMSRFVGDLMVPLVKRSKGISMARDEARIAGQVYETVLNGRMATLAELSDPYASGTATTRMMTNMANGFSKVNGLSYWNNFMKQGASTLTMSRVLKNSASKTISPREAEYMNFLGVDEMMRARIAVMFREFGETVDGVRVAHSQQWEDLPAARAFRAAVNKDVDSTIVTKGVGDIPIFANTELGKTVLQFKSFALAAHQRVLLRGLQEHDAAVASGMLASIGMGMLVYQLKALDSGRELSDDPRQWLVEGVDRSGLFTVMMEVSGILDQVGGPGLGRLSGGGSPSRFKSRNITGTLIGPSSGSVQDLATVIRSLTTGEVAESDIRAFRRLLPYQNLLIFRQLLDKLEEDVADELAA